MALWFLHSDFCFLFRCDSSVKHYLLTWIGTSYKFGFGEFECVEELLDYFQNSPLIGSESGKNYIINFWREREREREREESVCVCVGGRILTLES